MGSRSLCPFRPSGSCGRVRFPEGHRIYLGFHQPGGWGSEVVSEYFPKGMQLLKDLLIRKPASKRIKQTATHWKISKKRLFLFSLGFSGRDFWGRGRELLSQDKLLKSRGQNSLSITSVFFFFNDKVTQERKWKGKFLDFSSVQKAPGLFQTPVRVTVGPVVRALQSQKALLHQPLISIRKYNHQTTSQLLF